MSFPKAKIHRFNEEMTCAPPPGKYDPKFDTKVRGVVKFIEPKLSSASSAESIDSIGKSSNSNLPVFRTPQLKRSYLKTPKSVPANNITGSSINVRRNLVNESFTPTNESCRLKTDYYILTTQLQQKNDEIQKLNEELDEVRLNATKEQEKVNEKCKITEILHHEEVQNLNDEINELKKEIVEEKEKRNVELDKIVTESTSMIESMKLSDNEKIKGIEAEFDIYKMEMEVDFKVKLDECCEEMKKQLIDINSKVEDAINKVHDVESEFNKELEEFNKEMEENHKKVEDVLKDLTALNDERDELKACNLEQKKSLKDSNDIIKNLEGQLFKLDEELTRSKQTCKNFHVATMEHRKTIEALSKRLYESESEVERLNSVQSDLEKQKLLLESKAENLVMEIINLRESMKYLESEIIRDVEEIKMQLTAKVDSYRIKAAEETKSLLETVEEKQRTIDMLVGEIDYYRNRLKESEVYITNIKNKTEQFNMEIVQLKMKLTETEEEFSERMNAQKSLYDILDDNYKEKCDMIKKLQQIQVDQEQHMNELVEKLDHQSECAQKATAQINGLTSDNIVKEKQIENLVEKLEASSEAVKTISKHVENMLAEMDNKEKEIKMIKHNMELQTLSLISISNENNDLKYRLEQKMQHIEDLEKEVRETHKDNEKYVDELISEIVLEKERGSELASLLSQTEEEKMIAEDQLKAVLADNEELSCKCSSLKEELQKMTETVNLEKEECLRLSEILNKHEENKHELEEKLQKENIEKAQLILELSTKIDNLEELLKKAEEIKIMTEKENTEQRVQLQTMQEYINDLESVNECTKLKVDELNARVEEMSSELCNRTKEMEKLQSEFDVPKFEDAVTSLKEEIVLLCDNIDAREKKVDELMETKNNLEAELVKSRNEYEAKIQELEQQIKNEMNKNNGLSDSYNKMENRKNEYKLYSCKITEEVDQLKEQLKKLQDEKSKLESEKKQLEVMIGPFMKQLRDYEEEKNLLVTRKGAVEEELWALERKYAQSLGHQNLKQRIHYVSRLKEENIQFKQYAQSLGHQNLKQRIHYVSRLKEENIQFKQTIDHLTSENLRLKNKCKDLEVASRENSSPRTAKKSMNKERVHSPNILRDRNQH
ncbi:uncharacterized protein LOC142319957 [Lycorma delicatula]|uniref:uncharacterized protein LOC142319957 n=1 Tax=Lycorma delicatula TaxID=130591 RepID=UPI003F51A140